MFVRNKKIECIFVWINLEKLNLSKYTFFFLDSSLLPRNNTINFHYFANDRYRGKVHERNNK